MSKRPTDHLEPSAKKRAGGRQISREEPPSDSDDEDAQARKLALPTDILHALLQDLACKPTRPLRAHMRIVTLRAASLYEDVSHMSVRKQPWSLLEVPHAL